MIKHEFNFTPKKKYFEQIKAGIKHFEYRLDNDYWKKRLVGKTFDNVVYTLGYPKADDFERRIIRPWAGFEIQDVIHEEWGNIPQRVFAIKIASPCLAVPKRYENTSMKQQIFTTPRRGWLGRTPKGAEYMQSANERAKRMKAALRDPDQPIDKRQQRLPGF